MQRFPPLVVCQRRTRSYRVGILGLWLIWGRTWSNRCNFSSCCWSHGLGGCEFHVGGPRGVLAFSSVSCARSSRVHLAVLLKSIALSMPPSILHSCRGRICRSFCSNQWRSVRIGDFFLDRICLPFRVDVGARRYPRWAHGQGIAAKVAVRVSWSL